MEQGQDREFGGDGLIVDIESLGSTSLNDCKVILTTEWLQSSWRDSGYERFALV